METAVILDDKLMGEVQIFSDGKKAGKMDISLWGGKLTVYDTEVNEAYAGRGFAKLLLDKLVSYARENGLMIFPLCPFVYMQFMCDPRKYDNVWSK